MYDEGKKSGPIGAKEALGDKGWAKAMDSYESLKGVLDQSGVSMDQFMKDCGMDTEMEGSGEYSKTEEDISPADDQKKMAIVMALKKKSAFLDE
jgi:hypothetical protein